MTAAVSFLLKKEKGGFLVRKRLDNAVYSHTSESVFILKEHNKVELGSCLCAVETICIKHFTFA